MDYKTADSKLQGRCKDRRKIGNNTYLERRDNNAIAIRLHNTDIITFERDGRTILNSGGWRTVTTKTRMNDYIAPRIWQERGIWYLGEDTVFEDGITIEADGTITGGSPFSEAKKLLKFRRKVQSYAKGYTNSFLAGKVPAPGAGDCLYCGFKEVKTGKPLGELNRDEDHLRSHIEEKYYVPSLLANALEFCGASIAIKSTVWAMWHDQPDKMYWSKDDQYFRSKLQKYIGRYMLKQLGQAA